LRQALTHENMSDGLIAKLLATGTKLEPISQCCQDTINALVFDNSMMVCQRCRNLIKAFTDETAFRNYLIFCQSRGRKINAAKLGPYLVVAFKNYITY
jgi:hypothetical protein